MPHAVRQRSLHVCQLDEAERRGNIHLPLIGNGSRNGIDEFSQTARFLHGKIDALQDLHRVGRLQYILSAHFENLRLHPLDQICNIVQFGNQPHQNIRQSLLEGRDLRRNNVVHGHSRI
ncbi:hypothetical protein D3C87_1826980 [compost metagenome]